MALRALPALLLLAAPAAADPLCARLGAASYSATRVTTPAGAPPTTARVFVAGPLVRIEAPPPGPPGQPGRMVTITGPEGRILFGTEARPPVALRLPHPPAPAIPPDARRVREERGAEGVTLVTELRDVGNTWREVERATCAPDGVLLASRHVVPGEGGRPVVVEARQSDIRRGPQDPALFRPPEGFQLREAPPMR